MSKAQWIPPAPEGSVPLKSKPKARVFTWVILGINALFLVWIVAGIHSVSSANICEGMGGQALQNCQTSSALGTGIGVIAILFVCAVVDVILGVIWLVTRPRT